MVKELFEQDEEIVDKAPIANPRANNRITSVGCPTEVKRLLTGHLDTHSEHKLSVREEKFIEHYLETGNTVESAEFAGYTGSKQSLAATGRRLLNKSYIIDELKYRVDLIRSERTATTQEILEFFTAVMRGEVADQFGLEAPLSERTKAAQELAKRIVDTEIGSDKRGENVVRVVIERPNLTEKPVLAGDVFNERLAIESSEAEVADE